MFVAPIVSLNTNRQYGQDRHLKVLPTEPLNLIEKSGGVGRRLRWLWCAKDTYSETRTGEGMTIDERVGKRERFA